MVAECWLLMINRIVHHTLPGVTLRQVRFGIDAAIQSGDCRTHLWPLLQRPIEKQRFTERLLRRHRGLVLKQLRRSGPWISTTQDRVLTYVYGPELEIVCFGYNVQFRRYHGRLGGRRRKVDITAPSGRSAAVVAGRRNGSRRVDPTATRTAASVVHLPQQAQGCRRPSGHSVGVGFGSTVFPGARRTRICTVH